MRHHSTIARQDWLHAHLLHSGKNLFLQGFLLLIPVLRQRTTPTFQIVHLPPGKKGWSGDELAHFFLRITEFQEHIAPYAFRAHGSQWHIDAMQCHPVDFFLPSVPVPESHRIRKGAVIEVVTEFEVGFMAFFLFHGRKNVWQFWVHIVPGDVDAGMVFQIPVDAHGNIDPGVASDDDRIVFACWFRRSGVLAISSLVYLEEILV